MSKALDLSFIDQLPNDDFRNKIINGNFDIWQRGTSQTSSGYGSADRWNNAHVGSAKTTSRQNFTLGQTDVPGNPTFFMRTIVNSVAGSGNYVISVHPIEDVRTLSGKLATLTFWGKCDATRNITTEFYQSMGNGGSPSADVVAIVCKNSHFPHNGRNFLNWF